MFTLTNAAFIALTGLGATAPALALPLHERDANVSFPLTRMGSTSFFQNGCGYQMTPSTQLPNRNGGQIGANSPWGYYENVTFVETTTGSGTVAIARTVNGQDWGCMSWNTDNYNVTWVRCDPKTNVKGATPLDVYCNKEHSSSDVNWCLFSPNGSPAGSKSCLAEGTADFVKIDAHLPSVTCNAQDPETWYVWRIGKSSSC